DFAGARFRTIYSAGQLDFFALSPDESRAIVIGDSDAVIVGLANGDVLASVSTADFPEWAAGTRFSRAAWVEPADLAVVTLIRQERGPASWPGYFVMGVGLDTAFHQTEGFVAPSRDGSMLLVAD